MEFLLRLEIRLKLSLIVAASILVVTFIISSVTVRLQERESRIRTDILGRNIVQSISAVAADNLLLNSTPVLQDFITRNFKNLNIPGLEELSVIDRKGTIAADVVADSVDRLVSLADWDLIARADTPAVVETPTQFRYVEGIFVRKKMKNIFLGGAVVSFSKSALLAPIEEMKWKVILLSFLVSVAAISIVYLISKKVVFLILALSEAARRVGEGDLKVSVRTRIKDEVGILANEFNMMVLQLRQKVEMQKFVSRSTVQMIEKTEQADLGGTRKVVTVLFTDIRNFASMSEHRWPEEVVDVLNQYFDVQTKLIHAHDGVVDKFIGDGIMSIFTGPGMVEKAVSAADAIQKKIYQFNEGRRSNNEIVLEVGMGIATGPAVLGNIGSSDRMDYTVIGATVNLAARLCGMAGSYEILVSESVVDRLGGRFSSTSIGKLNLKGMRDGVPVHKIAYQLGQ